MFDTIKLGLAALLFAALCIPFGMPPGYPGPIECGPQSPITCGPVPYPMPEPTPIR